MALPWAASRLPLWGEDTPVIIEMWYDSGTGLASLTFVSTVLPSALFLPRETWMAALSPLPPHWAGEGVRRCFLAGETTDTKQGGPVAGLMS
jgi:hypothetical protein